MIYSFDGCILNGIRENFAKVDSRLPYPVSTTTTNKIKKNFISRDAFGRATSLWRAISMRSNEQMHTLKLSFFWKDDTDDKTGNRHRRSSERW